MTYIIAVLAAMDQGEAERIGERSARAKAELKKNGAWLGGGAPAYGYERIKDERGKVTHRIDPAQAAVLREAADRALAGELSRSSRESPALASYPQTGRVGPRPIGAT